MSEYTAEDFKNANIAVKGTTNVARRAEPDTTLPWVYGDNEWDDDKGMVENGWRPVFEHNPHATGTPEEEVQNLRDANAGLKMRVEYLNGELVLWQERLWQERASQAEAYARKAEAAPLTLDTLRDAYEQAEVPTKDNPIREGDELIVKHWEEGWEWVAICPGSDSENWISDARVLHRAPQPEPWQALAEAIEHYGWEVDSDDPKALARHLHERGVRVTGGDDQ